MARSIHATRRQLAELEQASFVDAETRSRRLLELQSELRKKRRVKRQVRERRRSPNAPTSIPSGAIPVQVFDTSPFAHYPAGPADLRAVLTAVPGGVADGLEAVELRMGETRQRDLLDEHKWGAVEPDPFTGRHGCEVMPNVFSGLSLGCYYPHRALIHLFGYVYPADISNLEVVEFYLRLKMLSTFVHEIAHHYDFTFRVFGDRWRADDKEKVEVYAEQVQHEWMTRYVIPYLETTNADQVAGMKRWIEGHVGAQVPLHLLAGDPRSTPKKGNIYISAFFSTSHAFEQLVTMVAQERPPDEIRVEFARELHYASEYAVPERILESVLADTPKHVDALALRADIAEHQGEFHTAIELARRALTIQRDHIDALQVLADVYEQTNDWKRLIRTTDRLLDLCQDIPFHFICALTHRATALLYLGRPNEAEEAIAALESTSQRRAIRNAKRLRRLMKARNGPAPKRDRQR